MRRLTPEYNHSTSGVLKNALDYLYAEWNNKAAGFVSYGLAGGARAAEQLRLVCAELQMADVRQQVTLSLLTEFEHYTVFRRLGAGRVIGAGRDPGRLDVLTSAGADDVVQLTADGDATARALGAAAAESDIVPDYVWGKPAQHAITALLTARSDPAAR